MTKYILAITALVVIYGTVCVDSKCDLMGSLKPPFNEISTWGKKQCTGKSEISEAQFKKAKNCYNTHIKPCMNTATKKKVDQFVHDDVLIPSTKKICKDHSIQQKIMDKAMDKLGSSIMKLQKEIQNGNECAKLKTHFIAFNKCCMH